MSGTKGMLHYSLETKRKAVRLIVEGRRTYAQVTEQLGIRKTGRIMAWVRMYRQEGEASFLRPIGRPPKAEAEQRELERLRMENALLKKFHSELRGLRLVRRNIGRSTTIEGTSK
jgi:transposase-like protein